jgi:hypothetical protein
MSDDGPKSRQQRFVIFSIGRFRDKVNTGCGATKFNLDAYMR